MKKFLFIVLCALLVLTAVGCRKENKTESVKLYFPDDSMYYDVEIREINADINDLVNLVETICREVIKGPTKEGLNASISGDVKVLSVSVENGICTIDLSEEFRTYNTGGTMRESIAIYSLVNSLCDLERVEKVKINIEGDSEAEFGGHFYLGDTFEFEPNMVRSEAIHAETEVD
ncbi:MAG: GerMN domain-containing protein [Clostridia bacterium]